MTYGIMAVDHEIRVDYEKLRKDRVQKTQQQMRKEKIGALLAFNNDHIRYITSTKIGEWNVEIRPRYCLLPVEGDPVLFEVGSAIRTKKMMSPWIKDIRPAKTDMQGTLPPAVQIWKTCAREIVDILKDKGLKKEPLGIDLPSVPLIRALEELDVNVVDGLDTLLNAQAVKTKEEIVLIETSTAMVDAAFWEAMRLIHPGIRESEVAGKIRSCLFDLGAENVLNAQVTSGNRTNPHPHDFTDRIIRPGDMIFMDVVNNFNGYKTCYYRTMICGKSTERQRAIYKKAYDWVYDAIKIIKPGISTADIARVWPDYKELGYESEYDALALELGHGIGITHWAKPVIARTHSFEHPEEIKENMVIAIENYYAEGSDGARIEEEVVVTNNGCRVLTRFPCDELISCW